MVCMCVAKNTLQTTIQAFGANCVAVPLYSHTDAPSVGRPGRICQELNRCLPQCVGECCPCPLFLSPVYLHKQCRVAEARQTAAGGAVFSQQDQTSSASDPGVFEKHPVTHPHHVCVHAHTLQLLQTKTARCDLLHVSGLVAVAWHCCAVWWIIFFHWFPCVRDA